MCISVQNSSDTVHSDQVSDATISLRLFGDDTLPRAHRRRLTPQTGIRFYSAYILVRLQGSGVVCVIHCEYITNSTEHSKVVRYLGTGTCWLEGMSGHGPHRLVLFIEHWFLHLFGKCLYCDTLTLPLNLLVSNNLYLDFNMK
ncbi:hypothetical protein HanIR_Chr11g0512131 [Helianthus annuus]|nr:hypothetical protein HanIR_Chr11g0512131 [Helianthus annuus]